MSGGEKEDHVGLMVVCVLIGKGMPLGREVVGFLFVLVTVWPREVKKWVFGFVPVLSDSEGEREVNGTITCTPPAQWANFTCRIGN